MQQNLAISPAVPPEPAGDEPVDIDRGVDFLLDLFGDDQFGFAVLAFIDPGDPGRIKHENIRLTNPKRAQIARRIIERYASTHDCYLSVANYAQDFSPRDANRHGSGGYAYRTKQMVGHCRWAFCDRDRHPLSPDLPQATFIVETSTGSYQDWYRLTAPVSGEEIEDLNRRIASANGVGFEKVERNALLRIPGTRNFKPRNQREIIRIVATTNALSAPADFPFLPPPASKPSLSSSSPSLRKQSAPLILFHDSDDGIALIPVRHHG